MVTDGLCEQLVTITSPLGLHARPAAQLARMASGFQATVTLERVLPPAAEEQEVFESDEADCRSIMSLLMLAAGKGTQLRLRAAGIDAPEAMRKITEFFESSFGEGDSLVQEEL